MGLMSGIGSFLGGKEEAKGFSRAKQKLEDLEDTAGDIKKETIGEATRSRKTMTSAGESERDRLSGISDTLYGEREGSRDFESNVRDQLSRALDGDIQETGGYQFTRTEALRGTARQASARGGNVGGGVLAELGERAAGLAGTEYNSIIKNLSNLLNISGSQNMQAQQVHQQGQQAASGQYSGLLTAGEQLGTALYGDAQNQYGGLMETAATGIANAEIGKSQAKAAGTAALFTGIENTAYNIMEMFPATSSKSGAAKQ